MGRSLVVVAAAPGPVTAAVRDVLRDWAALGLVQPFLWLETAEVDARGTLSGIVCSRITGESAERVRLQSELANTPDVTVLRLVALGALGSRPSLVTPETAILLNTGLSAATRSRLVPLQVVLTRQGRGGWHSPLELPGWRTLVVSPEDAFSPGRDPSEVLEDVDDTEPTGHAAAALAAVAGLWTGMDAAAFDTADASAVDEPQVVRAFLRRIDASAVTSGLRYALTDVSAGLPRPQTPQGPCAHLQSPGAAATSMAHAVLQRHAALFTVPQETVPNTIGDPVGPLQALARFFRFLWAALRRAPRELAEGLVNRGARGVSSRVQQALYGGDSRYEVVTRGINAQGLPAGVSELSSAAQDVAQRVAPVLATEFSLPDLTVFWRDVVSGGLSLADAGYERLPEIPAPVVDGTPGVVSETRWVAPAPSDAFVLPGGVAARLGRSEVGPHDVREHDAAEQVIAGAATEDVEAARQRNQFRDWRERVSTSYTGAVGLALSSQITARTARLSELLEELGAGRDPDDDSDLAAQQARVQRLLRDLLLGLLVVAAAVYVVFRIEVLETAQLVGLAALLTLTWVGISVNRLLKQQARVFSILNSRLHADRRLELASKNLGHAATALYLATTLYQQYLCWAPVLGRFLHEPFGPQPPVGAPVSLAGVLPRAVGFGVARPDPDAMAQAAAELAPAVFERRWLSTLWQALIDNAPSRLGPRAQVLRDDPKALLADLARDDSSLLRQWSRDVAETGVSSQAGDALWARARTALAARGTDAVVEALFTQVDVQAQAVHGVDGPRTGDAFFNELTDSLEDVSTHHLLPGLFGATALASGAHEIRSTVAVGRREAADTRTDPAVRWLPPATASEGDLDQFLVVLQATSPVHSSLLQLEGGEREQAAPAPLPGPATRRLV